MNISTGSQRLFINFSARVSPVSIMCSSFGFVRAFLPLMMGIVWERACRWPSPPDDAILEVTAEMSSQLRSQYSNTLFTVYSDYTAADAQLNQVPHLAPPPLHISDMLAGMISGQC